MPWTSRGGGNPWGDGSNGSWGRKGQSGGSNGGPPDLQYIIANLQKQLRSMLPNGLNGLRGILLVIMLGVVAWFILGGLYRVNPDEQGVALRFGKWVNTTGSGLHWNWPAPIGQVFKPRVTVVNQVEIGFSSSADIGRSDLIRDVVTESLMLTGDENIIDIQFVVQWRIADAGRFLFSVRNPRQAVKMVSESVIREVVGKTDFEFARTRGRGRIESDVQNQIQEVMDTYNTGIEIVAVRLQKVDPPAAVIDAFRDVQAARADKERAVNESQAYANEITQKAQGQADQEIRSAEAYKQEKISAASGEAQRFLAMYEEYDKSRDIVARRIYLETMEDILGGMDKVLMDSDTKSGAVPYISLNEIMRERRNSSSERGEQ